MTNQISKMPMLVIDACASDENLPPIQRNFMPRSLSLIDSGQIYKDLSGNLHYSSLKSSINIPVRWQSCPNQLLNTTTVNWLDPMAGLHSPGGSSSRYSLYGSFFNLSESEYIQTIPKISSDTYENKCSNWLQHLDIKQ